MADLTREQQRLLRYPPTPTSWQHAGCSAVNRGSAKACWLCCKPKPRTPRLLWPLYERACKVAGIEPGERWPQKAVPSENPPRNVTRRKR